MRLLRAYLMILNRFRDLDVTLHRDLDSLIDTWKQARAVDLNCSALIHTGFNRPTSDTVIQLLKNFAQKVLVTESTRFALPEEFGVYPRAVGTCKCRTDSEDISVYVAIKGWGYTYSGEDLRNELVKIESKINQPTGWVKKLSMDCPDLYLMLAEKRINDENDYIELKHKLPENIRNKIDGTRFQYLKDTVNEKDLWELLHIAPALFLKTALSSLELTIRLENIFKKYRIRTVENLLDYNSDSLLMLINFGWKSLVDLTEIIWERLQAKYDDQDIARNLIKHSYTEKNDDSTIDNFKKEDRLLFCLEKIFERYSDRDRQIILDRLGYRGSRITLELIGKKYGLTRERVRQIESRIIEKLNKSQKIKENIVTKITSLLKNRNELLLLELLETEDEWFVGFLRRYEFLAGIIENLSGNNFYVIRVLGRNIITRISQRGWENLTSHMRELLEDEEVKGWKKSEINLLIESVTNKNNVPELSNLIQDVIKDELVFARPENEESEIFIGCGATVEQLVISILTESDLPLHYTDIASRIKERYSKSIEPHHVINSAQTAGAKLFNRGTYGLMKHMPFEENEIEDIINTVESIVSEYNIDKQWHCKELANLIFERRPDLPETLDRYLLNIILDKSDGLISLGRLVWILKKGYVKSKRSRIDVSQAYISILEEAGKPLKEKELKRRLSVRRGINPNQQIFPSDRMIAILPGVWGLVERDIPASLKEREKLLNILYLVLQRRKKAIHLTEVQKCIEDFKVDFPKTLHPYALFRLAQNDSRFKIGHGQLLGLKTWKEFNRLNLSQAVRKVLSNSPSLNLDEIWRKAEKLAERHVDKQSVISILQNLGACYNEETGNWECLDTIPDL